MVFSSIPFIFIFLPIVLAGYWLIDRAIPAYRFIFLTIASLVFYAVWDWRYVFLLLATLVVNYFAHLYLINKPNKTALTLIIIFNLLLLSYFKYLGFVSGEISRLIGLDFEAFDILLPIGISFFTFQLIAFQVDTYLGKIGEQKVVPYALFVVFFPQLIAGPIVHHSEMMPQFSKRLDRSTWALMAVEGVLLFSIGLFKKTVIADPIGAVSSRVFAVIDAGGEVAFFEAWGAAFGYTFQLYFDFSGYADMAIGLGLLFGIRLPLNFNSPYKSVSIVDFWRRWHVTLSRFLRDYLYIPLGANRKGDVRRYANLMTTMVLGGIWHGAGWGFLIWGFMHGMMLAINHAWSKLYTVPGLGWLRFIMIKPVAIGITFLCVAIAWVPFRAETLEGMTTMFKAMFMITPLAAPSEFAGTPARDILISLGFSLDAVKINYLSDWAGIVPHLALAIVLAFFAPNSIAIASKFTQIIASFNEPDQQRANGFARFTKRIVPFAAGSSLASFFLWAVLHLSSVSEFLYFQF